MRGTDGCTIGFKDMHAPTTRTRPTDASNGITNSSGVRKREPAEKEIPKNTVRIDVMTRNSTSARLLISPSSHCGSGQHARPTNAKMSNVPHENASAKKAPEKLILAGTRTSGDGCSACSAALLRKLYAVTKGCCTKTLIARFQC